MHSRFFRLLIPLAALLAIAPLLIQGPSCGHDYDFHVLSWLEAGAQLTHGGYPHWAFTPAWNAGEPRFIFYPPLSWLLGAVLGLVLPWTYVPAAFTWCSLTLCGLVFERFARRYAGPAVASFTAVLYLANPYMLFVAYERTAWAELLAAAWFPLLFAAVFAPRLRLVAVAVPLGLLWLTNVPAAIMGSYALAFLVLLRLVFITDRGERLREACAAFGGALLGLALAGIYLIPAIYERLWISPTLALLPGLNPRNHFLFARIAPGPDADFHDAVVRAASWVAVSLLATSAVALIPAWRRYRREALPTALLALIILGLLLPFSLPVWNHLPELVFVQFPWRFDALLGTIFAVAVVLALSSGPDPQQINLAGASVASLIMALILILPAYLSFRQGCDPDDDGITARVELYHSIAGVEPIDEYTPAHADGDTLAEGDPGYWLLPPSAPLDAGPPRTAPPGQAPTHLTLSLPGPEILILNRRAYPIWRLRLNHRIVDSTSSRNDGLMTVNLPPGTSTIDLTYHRLWDFPAGILLSIAALLVTILLWLRQSTFTGSTRLGNRRTRIT